MRRHVRRARQKSYPRGSAISRHAEVHREVATDHPPHHGHPAALPGPAARAAARQALHAAAEAVHRVRVHRAPQLPQLQLRLLPAVPAARLRALLHVLPARLERQVQGAQQHVAEGGGGARVGRAAYAKRAAASSEAFATPDFISSPAFCMRFCKSG